MKKITLLFALFSILSTHAQWVSDTAVNTQIITSGSGDGDPHALTTSTGKTYVVFWKNIGAPKNYVLMLQVINTDGTRALGDDGMVISDAIPMSTYTTVWKMSLDASDNLYVGVTASGDTHQGYAFKMDTNGTQLWTSNGANGIVVAGNVYLITFLPTAASNGDVVISWMDGSGTGGGYYQRYTSDGTPIWSTPMAVATAYAPLDMYEVLDDYFLIIFSKPGITTGTYNLAAKLYDKTGTEQWTKTMTTNTINQINANSGFVDRNTLYYSYSSKYTGNANSYVYRLDCTVEAGTTPSPWKINGLDFSTSVANNETSISIAAAPDSQYVWAICNYSDSSQDHYGEYIQKFDKTSGARLFTDTAKEVFAISSDKPHVASLQLINDQPLFLLKSGYDNSVTPTTLNVCFLDANGDFQWAEQTKPMATYNASKGRISFPTPVNGQVEAVFVENKATGSAAYIQNFTDPLIPTNTMATQAFLGGNKSVSFTNPIADDFKINSTELIGSITIHNLVGQQIYTNIDVNSLDFSVIASQWNSGVYIVSVKMTSGKSETFKLIKR